MTITPEKADRLKQDATDGPWELDEHDVIMNGRVFRLRQQGKPGIRVSATVYGHNGDPELIAAAPDLAQAISGMRWEYRIEEWSGYYWYPCEEWTTDASLYEGYISRDGEQLVRRLVGPVEVVE